VGTGPFSIVTADFNGDTKLDLAVANQGSNTVSILLGNGNGTFQSRVDYATGIASSVLTTGDFNGDGNIDLVTSNHTSGTVSVLLGNGDGTFGGHVDYAAGPDPLGITAGDFNGDGKLDLAAAEFFGSNTVAILLGNGDGSFQSPVQYPVGNIPEQVATGDFNGDGRLDLAVSDEDCCAYSVKKVSILLGNGDGTFQPHVDYTAGAGPNGVAVADFNADGKLDLAVSNLSANTISILLGNGDGTFQPHVDYATPTQGGFGVVVTGDFNGDGQLDLVDTNDLSDTISMLIGNGDGTFQPRVDYATGAGPAGVAVGDFNGDGRLDLATTAVSILLQGTTVALSNISLTFGLQLVGTTSSPQEVTLTNTGPIALNISSITASGDFLQENNCGSSLPAGESCTIRVAFRPSDKGVRSGAVTITDNAANSPQTIALTGTGTVVQLSPMNLNFGNQRVGTISPPHSITLTNTGSAPLHIQGIAISGHNFGDFIETTTCGSSLPADTSCAIQVRFSPMATGPRQASLRVRDDGGGGTQDVKLTGTGIR
jgi:hypothetical protein